MDFWRCMVWFAAASRDTLPNLPATLDSPGCCRTSPVAYACTSLAVCPDEATVSTPRRHTSAGKSSGVGEVRKNTYVCKRDLGGRGANSRFVIGRLEGQGQARSGRNGALGRCVWGPNAPFPPLLMSGLMHHLFFEDVSCDFANAPFPPGPSGGTDFGPTGLVGQKSCPSGLAGPASPPPGPVLPCSGLARDPIGLSLLLLPLSTSPSPQQAETRLGLWP